eukprot:225538_1
MEEALFQLHLLINHFEHRNNLNMPLPQSYDSYYVSKIGWDNSECRMYNPGDCLSCGRGWHDGQLMVTYPCWHRVHWRCCNFGAYKLCPQCYYVPLVHEESRSMMIQQIEQQFRYNFNLSERNRAKILEQLRREEEYISQMRIPQNSMMILQLMKTDVMNLFLTQ